MADGGEIVGYKDYFDILPLPSVPSSADGTPRPSVSDGKGLACFPYKHAYRPGIPFQDIKRNVFVPSLALEAKIVNVERSFSGGHFLSPNVYEIELTHGEFKWRIKRRYKDFSTLHQQLQFYKTTLNLPIPTKTHKQKRTFRSAVEKVQNIPRFPKRPEAFIPASAVTNRARQLERYLNCILESRIFRNYVGTLTFLEVSHLSFIADLGNKRMEGMVRKRAGGVRIISGFRSLLMPCRTLCRGWLERWLILKDTFIALIRPADGIVREVLLMDSKFDIHMGFYETGTRGGILLFNQSRYMVLKGANRERTLEWMEEITQAAKTTGRDFVSPNRFGSFAPIRNHTMGRWFVDGVEYFSSVADALEAAQEEIFIADWMLSPEIFLKRPIYKDHYWRLDKILQRKASQGVHVYIMLYKEVELALSIASDNARRRLMAMHPEIKVLRHPNHAQAGVLLWAHHEKIVVVDQTYAFLGGLDLCFGRWDSHEHQLCDLGSLEEAAIMATDAAITKTEARPLTITSLRYAIETVGTSPFSEPIDAEKLNDTNDGKIEEDIEKEIIQKNVVNNILSNMNTGNGDCDCDPVIGTKLFPGKDYMNFIVKDFCQLDYPFQDIIERSKTPRLPWHDIAVMVQGPAARDAARHFIQRWNNLKSEKCKEADFYPFLLPKTYTNFVTDDIPEIIPNLNRVSCQILRSSSCWSAGITDTEDSIQQGYVKAISEAKHFIYIENQFFVSQTGEHPVVTNKIATAIFERIVRAHKDGQIFRVYVVMPLLPAFEGEIGTNTGVSIHAVTHWNYASMCRGPNSLYEKLSKTVGDPATYITFYGLRTHGKLMQQHVSELVYVHSKLMIVDDRIAIIGSANINDRSLVGFRDSEIAAFLEDTEDVESRMAGELYLAGRFIRSIRKRIFKEHLGILSTPREDFDVTDPVSDTFFKDIWLKTAALNTSIFEKVFNCIPSDAVKTFAQARQHISKTPLHLTDLEQAERLLSGIQGQLVLMPLHFLSDEDLRPPSGTKEALMPDYLWT